MGNDNLKADIPLGKKIHENILNYESESIKYA